MDSYVLDNGDQTSTRSGYTLDNGASSDRHLQVSGYPKQHNMPPYLGLGLAALGTLGYRRGSYI